MKRIILFSVLWILIAIPAFCQIEELPAPRSLDQAKRTFRITTDIQDTCTVKIISPRGEIQSVPVVERSLVAGGQLELALDTQFWRPGWYRIVAKFKRGRIETKRIQVGE